MLTFLGRGSAFADAHNCAFFTSGEDLILLDCPASAFPHIKHMHPERFRHIYILVTHTHGDHSGGVGMLLQYAYFALQNPLTVVAPSEEVKDDLHLLLCRIEGCEKDWFQLTTADLLEKEWLIQAIPTQHVQPLDGKCFGYALRIHGHTVVYTGDTAVLAPYLPYLQSGDVLYTECAAIQSGVHLYLPDVLPTLIELTERGVQVFLMHLDHEQKISQMIQGTKLQLAPMTKRKTGMKKAPHLISAIFLVLCIIISSVFHLDTSNTVWGMFIFCGFSVINLIGAVINSIHYQKAMHSWRFLFYLLTFVFAVWTLGSIIIMIALALGMMPLS